MILNITYADFIFYCSSERDLIIRLTSYAAILQDADDFIRSRTQCSTYDTSTYKKLVQQLEDVQRSGIRMRPLLEADSFQRQRMVCLNDIQFFNIEIEEHAFLRLNPLFEDQYYFAHVGQSFAKAARHFEHLNADCTLLQLMYSARVEKSVPVESKIRMTDIEQRAWWHASELCRCTLFFSQRSLTAARFLHMILQGAANFFESCGAMAELGWCKGCLLATSQRIKRVREISGPTLCPLEDLMTVWPRGCCYGPKWKMAFEDTSS